MVTHSILQATSCLENPRDGGAWWAAVYGVAQSWTRLKWLSSSSIWVCHSFSFKEQASFNCMAAVTIHSDFRAQEMKSATVSIFSPSICHKVMGQDAMVLVFWILIFKPAFSLSFSPLSRGSLVPLHFLPLGWYGGTSGEESACQCRRPKKCRFDPWVRKIPWRGSGSPLETKWQPTPVFLSENAVDRGVWEATVRRVTELDVTDAA